MIMIISMNYNYNNYYYYAISLHTHAGQVDTSHIVLELKVHLHPTLTCPDFLVSCLGYCF